MAPYTAGSRSNNQGGQVQSLATGSPLAPETATQLTKNLSATSTTTTSALYPTSSLNSSVSNLEQHQTLQSSDLQSSGGNLLGTNTASVASAFSSGTAGDQHSTGGQQYHNKNRGYNKNNRDNMSTVGSNVGSASGNLKDDPSEFFSLNSALVPKLQVADHNLDANKEYPLRYPWILSEMAESGKNKQWDKDGIHEVAKIDSIASFWKYWNFLPQPSELLLGKRLISQRDGTSPVSCVMLFRAGIKPAWEDPLNMNGGEFQFRLKKFTFQENAALADEYWNNLVLGVLGGQIQPSSMITGLRLVDRLEYAKTAAVLRIEVWFTDKTKMDSYDAPQDLDYHALINKLKKSVENCMLTKLNGETRKEKLYGDVSTNMHNQGH
ncbi:unnamed protein product [Amoebophrya sp. A120]|nr:unnamed protein product [Amoebophrya sp. A120]|eukprot:GSA120T00014729001.1